MKKGRKIKIRHFDRAKYISEPESLASFFCCHGNVAFFTRTAIKNPPVSCWCGSTLMLKDRKSVLEIFT